MYKTQLHVLISVALLGITIAMDQLLYQVLKRDLEGQLRDLEGLDFREAYLANAQ